jgi:hypothetical protein
MCLDSLIRVIRFLNERISYHSSHKERLKYAALYRQTLEFVEIQVPKEVVITPSVYNPYKCPICENTVYESWEYCCKCGNKLLFK